MAEITFLSGLGVNFVNADAPAASECWEELSPEQSLTCISDVIFDDVYSTGLTVKDRRGVEVYARIPAVEAGQIGLWKRDCPLNCAGITDFLEALLVALRDAEKLS